MWHWIKERQVWVVKGHTQKKQQQKLCMWAIRGKEFYRICVTITYMLCIYHSTFINNVKLMPCCYFLIYISLLFCYSWWWKSNNNICMKMTYESAAKNSNVLSFILYSSLFILLFLHILIYSTNQHKMRERNGKESRKRKIWIKFTLTIYKFN